LDGPPLAPQQTKATVTAERFTDLLAAFLTPITAVLALYVAFRQHHMQREQVRTELYQRRIAIYRSYTRFLAKLVFTSELSPQDVYDLRADTLEAPFLFDPEDARVIAELAELAANQVGLRSDLKDPSMASPRYKSEMFSVGESLRADCQAYLSEAEARFRRYLIARV
jgi:hypothetical protein